MYTALSKQGLNRPPTAVGAIRAGYSYGRPTLNHSPLTKEHLEEDHSRTHKRFGQNGPC